MSLLSSLVALLVGTPGLPVGECVPASPLVFPETRAEGIDLAVAMQLARMSRVELEGLLAKQGAVLVAGPRLIVAASGQAVPAGKPDGNRFEVIELEGEVPIHLISYAGARNPADAATGERKSSHEIIASGDGLTVNLSEQVVIGEKVVAHETRSHWVSRREGKALLVAAVRCTLGRDGQVPAPRWTVGATRVEVTGCGGEVAVRRDQLDGCAVAPGSRRAMAYLDLAVDVAFYDDPMQQARILRLALAASGARTAESARRLPSVWSLYGKALLRALRAGGTGSQWEITNAFENAIASEVTDLGKGYAARLLGDAYAVFAGEADGLADKRRNLEAAVAAYERSQGLDAREATVAALQEAKTKLAALR